MAADEEFGTTTELYIPEVTTIENDVNEVDSKVVQIDQAGSESESESESVKTANHLIKLFANIHRLKNVEIDSHVLTLVGNLVVPLCKEGQNTILANLLNRHIGTLKLPERVVITDDNISTLMNILSQNTTITKLVISFNNIGNVGIGLFAIYLDQNKFIKMLDLSYNQITDTGAILLTAALNKNSSITMVDLSDRTIFI
jgi:hypothetical protein